MQEVACNNELLKYGGFTFDETGNLYLSNELAHCIEKYDPDGRHVLTIGSEGHREGEFYYPRGLAVDGEGNLWVADSWNHRLQKFDPGGRFLEIVGRMGSGESEFIEPSGVAVDRNGTIYIADMGNHRIQVISQKENIFFIHNGFAPHLVIKNPCSVSCDNRGNIYILNAGTTFIQSLRVSAKTVYRNGQKGSCKGCFVNPAGATVKDGRLFVLDNVLNKVIVFNESLLFVNEIVSKNEKSCIDLLQAVLNDKGKVYNGGLFQRDRGYLLLHNDELEKAIDVFGESVELLDPLRIEDNIKLANAFFEKKEIEKSLFTWEVTIKNNLFNRRMWDIFSGLINQGQTYLECLKNKYYLKYDGLVGKDLCDFKPHSMAIDIEGNFIVAEAAHNRVALLNKEFKLLSYIGNSTLFNSPVRPYFDVQGNLYISNLNSNNVNFFDNKYELIETLANLDRPHGLVQDDENGIYVTKADLVLPEVVYFNHLREKVSENKFNKLLQKNKLGFVSKMEFAGNKMWFTCRDVGKFGYFDGAEIVTFGKQGRNTGEIMNAGSLAIDEHFIYVLDEIKMSLGKYEKNGSHLYDVDLRQFTDIEIPSDLVICDKKLFIVNYNRNILQFSID